MRSYWGSGAIELSFRSKGVQTEQESEVGKPVTGRPDQKQHRSCISVGVLLILMWFES